MRVKTPTKIAGLMISLLLSLPSAADELRYAVGGVSEPLLGNVKQHLEQFGFMESRRLAARRFEELRAAAEERAAEALKPYGYYLPEITTSMKQLSADSFEMRVQIQPGTPMRIVKADIDIVGPGATKKELREWLRTWPLPAGSVLNQPRWDEQKKIGLAAAESQGFLGATFTEHRIEVDVVANTAVLTLIMDTGPQALFGDIRYDQDAVHPWVLENVPRFAPGEPYNAELLEQFRLDLWRTGYFSDIDVIEERELQQTPPKVDLGATLSADTRDTYQGALGFGTDTGIRLQGLWSRHLWSPRGDRLDIGAGYREIDDEVTARLEYRIPRRTQKRQFWVATGNLSKENQDLEFKRNAFDEGFVQLANGQVEDLYARFGRLNVRDRKQGFQQINETVYVQLVRESFDYRPGENADPGVLAVAEDPRFSGIFKNTINSLAVGIEWDWPAVRGSAFMMEGHHEQAWLFTSSDLWGSERNFSQVYISSRRAYLYGDRFKVLLRAEVGFSDAEVRELNGTVNGEPFELSVSQLPDTYRFKAGGSSSVRGYDFESLSDNDIGSNNLIAGSIEVETKLSQRWSVAAFTDIGNAFNDWGTAELRKGIGFGVRWYSVAGAIRVDFAKALDIEGKPWRIHFTMGSPLL